MSPDLIGRAFGRMTVIGPASQDVVLPWVAGGWWLGRCVCGREVIAPAEAFLSRRLTSCGRPTPEDRAAEEAKLAALLPPARL
jgi:hypothetical protein